MKAKAWILTTTLCFVTLSSYGLDQTESSVSARLSQIAGAVSVGADTGWTGPGYSAALRDFTFFDPDEPGFFYGWGIGVLTREIGGAPIADTSPAMLGWLGTPLEGLPIEVLVAAGPTLGARMEGNRILGGFYTGIGLQFGFHVLVNHEQSVGVEVFPVLSLETWGAPRARNLSYCDIGLSWTTRSKERKTKLIWGTEP